MQLRSTLQAIIFDLWILTFHLEKWVAYQKYQKYKYRSNSELENFKCIWRYKYMYMINNDIFTFPAIKLWKKDNHEVYVGAIVFATCETIKT